MSSLRWRLFHGTFLLVHLHAAILGVVTLLHLGAVAHHYRRVRRY